MIHDCALVEFEKDGVPDMGAGKDVQLFGEDDGAAVCSYDLPFHSEGEP